MKVFRMYCNSYKNTVLVRIFLTISTFYPDVHGQGFAEHA